MQEQTSGRFDYVKYDGIAQSQQSDFKTHVTQLEGMINSLNNGRYKALALTSLEEVYMWIGKALRDSQIARNGSAELQEQRTNS